MTTDEELSQMSTEDLWDEYDSLSETIAEAGAESQQKLVKELKIKHRKIIDELIKRGETK